MGVATRYFGPTSAGSGDGTSWANRAALMTSPTGAFNGLIAGFDFSAGDSLLCLVGPGTYGDDTYFTDSISLGDFVNPPTQQTPLMIAACDSSGDLWQPPDPDWVSAQPCWDTSGMPEIRVGNTPVFDCPYLSIYGLRIVTTAKSASAINEGGSAEWIVIDHSGSGTSAKCVSTDKWGALKNCCFSMSGSSIEKCIDIATTPRYMDNIRIEATGSPTGGNRFGIEKRGNSAMTVSRVTAIGFATNFRHSASGTNSYAQLTNCVSVNSIGNGVEITNNNSSCENSVVSGSIVVGSGAYGLNATVQEQIRAINSRLRDNISGNTTNGNDPLLGCEVGSGVDASEFVDAANGDYRIKSTSSLWGRGIGAGDEPSSGGG
ncbi:MAG: hypothetical protein ACIAQF_08285 [Phycisphaerales bacterium JB065]